MRRRRPYRRGRSFKKRRFSRKKRYSLYKKPRSDHYNACFDWDRDLVDGRTINSGSTGLGAVSQKVIDFNLGQFTKIAQNWYTMFERVRVNMIAISFRVVRVSQVTSEIGITGAVAANAKIPLIWHRVDYNSQTIDFSGTYDDIIERFEARPGVKKQPMTRGFKYTLRPRLLNTNLSHYQGPDPVPIYNVGPKKPWIEMTDTGFLQAQLWPNLQVIYENQASDGAYRLVPSCKVFVTFAGRRK